MTNKAHVVLLWHMHQPYYVNPVSDIAILPWVRLHAIKDYYDMVKILESFPDIKVNFNLVPSLLDQIEQYVRGDIIDTFLEHTVKPAHLLSDLEKAFILDNFFHANYETMIQPYHKFTELYHKRRGIHGLHKNEDVIKLFSDQDFLDLQVWFNLCWFGAYTRDIDPLIQALILKDSNFTEDEKMRMVKKQFEIMGKVITEYKAALDRGQIELSTTAYYHPILPLLIDTEIARESDSNVELPSRMKAPEDARKQVREALDYMQEKFGKRPVGMWPAEGAISDAALRMMAEEGVQWTASDQDVLNMSFQRDEKRLEVDGIYSAYSFECAEKECMGILFRDRVLSDKIGFDYKYWKVEDAIKDFIRSMEHILDNLEPGMATPVIPIVLDGENAWEHFPNNGWEFLHAFYQAISDHPQLISATISDYLHSKNTRYRVLDHVHPGSWIHHDFGIWIGHEEDNQAWALLKKAREDLLQWESGKKNLTNNEARRLRLAWKSLYIAEGSDWNWWYGDDHSTANDKEFDELFRQHILNVYEFLGLVPPKTLFLPIKKISQTRPEKPVTGIINPTLDGSVTDFYEWQNAGHYSTQSVGERFVGAHVIRDIFFGFNEKNLFLRIDLDPSISQERNERDLYVVLKIIAPVQRKLIIELKSDCSRIVLLGNDGRSFDMIDSEGIQSVCNQILEIQMPFSVLNIELGAIVQMLISVEEIGREIERWPVGNILEIGLPAPEDLASLWVI